MASHEAAPVSPLFEISVPANLNPLIGRTTELAQIGDVLSRSECRLLTLIGTGGVGKTRLALEAARAQRNQFADGVMIVPLAAVTDSALIPPAIAQSLRISLSGPAETQLITYLHDKTMLLVLDNCEQLTEGIDWLLDMLAHAPGIKLLATSRERLQLAEEWVYPVPMLDEAHAVDLFAQTAQRVNPHFQLANTFDAVTRICQLVEHLPLATELAASWTPLMSCDEIAHNIQHDIDFLSANVRNMPARHRSIRAVFDHSWRLLTPIEQDVLMRLSVFRDGWTIEEMTAIAGGDMFILRALVEKSLVRSIGQGRYDLHELIRQYAADQLSTAGEEARTRQRHAEVYLVLAGVFDAQLHTSNGIAAFARLDQEQGNIRAGLNWTFETGAIETARQYVDKLCLYWWRRGHWSEGEQWTKAVDARHGEGDSTLLCWALMDASFFLALQGRFAESIPYMSRAEAMAVRLEDPETTLRLLIIQVQARSNIDVIIALFEAFFSTARQVQNHSKSALEAMVAGGYAIYGDRLREAGRLKEAEAQYRQSLDLWRSMGNLDAIAYPIGNLGRLALHAGRTQEAYERLHESVAIARAIGNRVAIVDWLPHLGSALLSMGDVAQAEACYDEALALCEEMGNHVAATDILAYLGYTCLIKGEAEQAREHFRRSLSAYRTFVETQPMMEESILIPPEFLLCLRGMALLDLQAGLFERALLLFSASAAIQSRLGADDLLGPQVSTDDALRTLQSKIAPERFASIWDTGQSMSPDAIVGYALEVG